MARALISMYLQHIGPISGVLTPAHTVLEVPIMEGYHRLCGITQKEGNVFWFHGGELGVHEHFPERKVRHGPLIEEGQCTKHVAHGRDRSVSAGGGC